MSASVASRKPRLVLFAHDIMTIAAMQISPLPGCNAR
jgi:hypothetical protein